MPDSVKWKRVLSAQGTAQYRQSRMGLLMVAQGLNKAQFICCISRFVTWFPTIPHISSVQLAKGVLYPSYFPHLSARFKLLHVMVVLFLLLEFLPSCFQAENQIYKSKAMGERHQDWRAFKSFQSSQSFREWNKQEIKMKLEMVENPLFRRLKPGAFLWYILWYCWEWSLPTLIKFITKRND